MTRNELLNLVRGQCRGCGRAIDDPRNSTEVYGLFSDMRGSNPAWLVEVVHRLGKRWIFAVVINDVRSYTVCEIGSVDWSKWVSGGDKPEVYKEKHDAVATINTK